MKVLYSFIIVFIVFTSCKKVDIYTAAPLRTDVSNTLQYRPAVKKGNDSIQIDYLRGKIAQATFVSWDATGCIETTVNISGTDQLTLSTGQPFINTPSAIAIIDVYNWCTFVDLEFAQGSTPIENLHITPGLNSASLVATIPMQEAVQSTSFNLDVNLTWAASGPLAINVQKTKTQDTGGSTVVTVTKGYVRPATATGTAISGSTIYASGAAVDASLEKDVNSTITITKK